MTPGARVQAAIDCLERILQDVPAEKALTAWARGSRFAGSKDRAAVRDHVYDVLRRKRACALLGGGETARALAIGLLRLQGKETGAIFDGSGYAPAPLTPAEAAFAAPVGVPDVELPDWLIPILRQQYEGSLEAALAPLEQRANVFLRVNLKKSDLHGAVAALAEDGVQASPVGIAQAGLVVTEGARRAAQSRAYREGLVELQDAASQAAMETVLVGQGVKVLDYCAGGGGKTLALAGRRTARYFAHDANPGRMRDLPARANRAGIKVRILDRPGVVSEAPYDIVLCDVPCSGSGTWARDPDAKWRFSPARLDELGVLQTEILAQAKAHVAPAGQLIYATCSLLKCENDGRISEFLHANADWECRSARQWHLTDGADGFFIAHLKRK